MSQESSLKIIQKLQISPPANTVQETSIPLTFFDTHWLPPLIAEHLLFFDFPHQSCHFFQTVLPDLIHNLSLTLQDFFPFASNFVCPTPPQEPYILYKEGYSLPLTIAESAADFNHITGDDAKDVKELYPFVPKLPARQELPDGSYTTTVMAIQVTLFPNSGICVGFTLDHVVADGMAYMHFVKSWASLCKTKGDLSVIEKSKPCHKRKEVQESPRWKEVQDPDCLRLIFLKYFWDNSSSVEKVNSSPTHDAILHASFTMTRAHIEGLKSQISKNIMKNNQSEDQSSHDLHLSSFVVTCAFAWICLLRSRERKDKDVVDSSRNKEAHLAFLADCRNRFGLSIPNNYFGNCLAPLRVYVKMHELLSENGIVAAVKGIIESKIRELKNGGALKKAEGWLSEFDRLLELGNLTTVAGSPRMKVYETDFGWGRAKKSKFVHLDASSNISLTDCRDEEGGIEISMALTRVELDVFKSTFKRNLNTILSGSPTI